VLVAVCTVKLVAHEYFKDDPRTQRQRMVAGDLYIADDPELERRQRRAALLADLYHQQVIADDPEAHVTLRSLIGEVGDGVVVRPPLFVDYGENITIGARTFINYNLTALDVATIRIGADCQIGPGVQLLTPTHPVDPDLRRDKLEAARPITLADNVWLGGGVIVCPGVTIGENSVIGAGAVVTRNVPANTVAAGNPARCMRQL
jgi:maltose O-acetyltransferase